jgi:hypothetical protein
MSEENVEVVRRGRASRLRRVVGSGDFDRYLETIDPDIRWDISAHPLPDVPNTGQGPTEGPI